MLLVPCLRLDAASLCALGSLGTVVAWSSGITSPRSDSALFATAGARAGFDWPLSAMLALRAHVDLATDLRRPHLQVDGTDAWTAPRIAAAVGAGFAAHFE